MDWKSRFRNKTFLVTLFAALLVFVQFVLQPFGITVPVDYLTSAFGALLVVLCILGIVVDPTTPGITDRIKRANMPERHYKLKRSKVEPSDLVFIHTVEAALFVDLRRLFPPIFNQLNLGACTANAGVAVMMYIMIVKYLKDNPSATVADALNNIPALSRLYMYYEERAIEGTISEDSGASIKDECKVGKKGVCAEIFDPYDIIKFAQAPSPEAIADALNHKITSYKSVSGLTGIKKALTLGIPVLIGIAVFESFEGTSIAETGIMPIPKKSEKFLGGHALAVVGYDDAKKMLIVRNSWGEDWGDEGYFYMPYSYLTLKIGGQPCTYDYWIMQ